MWFRHRQRVDSAFAKGLMFGKAIGKRDERERIIAKIESDYECVLDYLGIELGIKELDILQQLIEQLKAESND